MEGKGFVKAKDLTTEEKLTLSDGKQVEIEKLDKPETKYNFEVEGFHTYFVTEKAVLVHNECVYRGGEYKYREMDIKIDKKTGLVKPERGISVNADPSKVEKFGRVSRVDFLSDGLELKAIGASGHYEIVPKIAMSKSQYQALLDQIIFTYI